MLADKIITRLDGVKSTGQDRWIAKCPSHEDKSPSLTIREVDDRLLIHCFAGCEPYEIVLLTPSRRVIILSANIVLHGLSDFENKANQNIDQYR